MAPATFMSRGGAGAMAVSACENTLRLLREHRGQTAAALAASGTNEATVLRLEGGAETLERGLRACLAANLRIEPDDLDPWPRD